MQTPAIAKNEAQRVSALKSLQLLDTSHEPSYDRIARLAQRIFDVPIALVSLVDESRQWFKSCIGLDVSQTPKEISFCGHAILCDAPLIVPDALQDARFFDNPLVLGSPNIRFYAGYPLKVADNIRVGTLCIIDTKPRKFTAKEQLILQDLGGLVERELATLKLATEDELTKIANRRGFLLGAEKLLDLCQRRQLGGKLIYLDLDSFKPVNDQFGHQKGDELLIAFADIIRKNCRKSDVYGRLGGDEFALLLTDLSEQESADILRRLQQQLSLFSQQQQFGFEITFSVGAVDIDIEQPQTLQTLITQADEKMFDAKRMKK